MKFGGDRQAPLVLNQKTTQNHNDIKVLAKNEIKNSCYS